MHIHNLAQWEHQHRFARAAGEGERNTRIVIGLSPHVTGDIPRRLVERLIHYYSTYKMIPGRESTMVIGEVYGVDHALQVVTEAIDDYAAKFGQSNGRR